MVFCCALTVIGGVVAIGLLISFVRKFNLLYILLNKVSATVKFRIYVITITSSHGTPYRVD